MKKSLAHQLADYACALRFEDLSKDVVHEVKRRVLDCARVREVDEARSAKNAPRREHCRSCKRSDAAGARGRAVALERRGFRKRGAARGFFGALGPGWHDWTGSDFRRPNGI